MPGSIFKILLGAVVTVFSGMQGCDQGEKGARGADYLSYCTVDSSKTGYDLAADYDDCIGIYAQMSTASINSDSIEVRVDYLPPIDFFSARALLNQEERWVQAHYSFIPEDISDYGDTLQEINGVVPLKLKTKESIDKAFGLDQSKPGGRCADVQQVILDNVLNSILTAEQRSKYLKDGRKLTLEPDDDRPPLSETTNPANNGGVWMERDPADQVIDHGDSLSYGPPAFYAESDDPDLPEGTEESLKGVMYCKLLSHQLILHWMQVKSFEQDTLPVAPARSEVCTYPHSFEALYGSCVFYFPVAASYYCSDYTGYGFDKESAMRKCASRPSSDTLVTEYSELPCDQRVEEVESKIPDYAGFQGVCIIHCQEEGEFVWNIYQADPEPRCADYPYLSPEDKQALLEETR